MKIIDKTPFQNDKGELGLIQRFQGIMEYGVSWPTELEAQKTVITQLDRVLEKGFTLIRNLNLENSKITEPLILVGPPGVFVLYVTPVSGFYEAKGDQWNVVNGERRTAAPINLLTRVARLARALQVYLNRQGVYLPGMVEPVLMTSSPGLHVELARPIVRVVMSDAIKQFAASLMQSRAVLRSEVIYDVVDHIVNPRPKGAGAAPEPGPSTSPAPIAAESQDNGQPASRARAIFHAAEEVKPFDPADLDFEFDEKAQGQVPEGLRETSPSQKLGTASARPKGALSTGQLIILAAMVLVECAVLAGFAYFMLFANR
jgi:hypothetical protein